MRCGCMIMAISSLAFVLVASAQDTGKQGEVPQQQLPAEPSDAGDRRVEVKKAALPPVKSDPMQGGRPLGDLVIAFESGRFVVPAEANAADLVRYLNELSTLKDDLAEDYRDLQASILQAQAKAAGSILDLSSEVSDREFYVAARLGLSERINQIPSSSFEAQQQTIALVVRQLEIGAEQGLKMDEIRNAIRTADYLERYGDRGLALEACDLFAQIIRDSNNPRYQSTVEQLQDTTFRLELVGQPFELTGTTVDGRPFRWSDYRGKVVLVNFWASWSLPSVAELPQLKRVYDSYHGDGFEVVGVSLDRNRAAVESVIAKEKIPWTTLFEARDDAEHSVATKYGVRAIPSAFLIDAQGRVVSTQARGSELDQQLARLLGRESLVARNLAMDSKWSQAATELLRLLTEHPGSIDDWLALGSVQLLGKDPLGYAGTCQASWSALMQSTSALPAGIIPLYCLPAAHSLNRNQIYQDAVKLRADSDSDQARLAVIMSAYRAGRDQACLQEEIIDGDAFSVAIAALTRSMAAHRLGKAELADLLMLEGTSLVATHLTDLSTKTPPANLPYEHWVCCCLARLMLAETESVLGTSLNAEE